MTPSIPDRPPSLHEGFFLQALRSPDRIALIDGERTVTYGELATRVRRVAGGLESAGVTPGSAVGLHLPRSTDWVVGTLAILRAGATVVPLPPADPELRLLDVLARTRATAVVGSGAPLGSERNLSLAALAGAAPLEGDRHGGSEGAAYILSSSGSTGRPKLIVRTHRSFFHRLSWTWARHPFGPSDVGCQKAHATTTHSVYELFEPLLAGAPLVMVSEPHARDLEKLWALVRDHRVTRLLIVPSALRALLEGPGFDAHALSVVVLMGEAVSSELADRAASAFPARTHLYSVYGSTEASSSLVTDLRAPRARGREVLLGRPLTASVRVRVVAPDRTTVPPGGEGRLLLAGPQLFSGYLGDSDATNAVLVRLPGEDEPFYDTRDQVALEPDGSLRFVGRVDDTVKIRGFRVDLREIEAILREHPDVREAAVVTEERGAERSLVAFVTPSNVDPTELVGTLRSRVPPYMIPSRISALDRFPLTSSGKVDRVNLADAAGAAPTPTPASTRGLSETERRVADVWRRTLGHDRFGPTDDFFGVGGTSLTVFTLVRGLRDLADGAGELTIADVYRSPTVEGLAKLVAGGGGGRGGGAFEAASILVTLRRGDEDRPPLFVIAPAGGAVGPYEKLARALSSPRSVVGLRDPFLLGQREGTESFGIWVDRYLAAIRLRQPRGPYHLCAYSSAGAFGYELAQRLRSAGEQVPLLALVDPQALDRTNRGHFGFWALEAVWMGAPKRAAVRLLGRLRTPIVGWGIRGGGPADESLSPEELNRHAQRALSDARHVTNVSVLMELNSGARFALDDVPADTGPRRTPLDALLARARRVAPDLEPWMIERMIVQYDLQIRAQHRYRLRPYGGPVLLFEPKSHYAGLVATVLRPYVRRLRAKQLDLGTPSERTAALTARFGRLEPHYRCMRDDRFVDALAREIDAALDDR